jgi:MFS family permease
MTETIRKRLNDNPVARWSVLAIISITMMCGYFITDVMAPLQTMLEDNFGWNGTEYGLFTGSYGWFNVFLFMLIIGGLILDKKGVRFTGTLACILMIAGCAVKYYAISPFFVSGGGTIFGMRSQIFTACLGFATFGVGVETAGITVTKVLANWFKGKEIALAMGLQVATARIGTSMAFSFSVPLAKRFGEISAPVLLGLAILCVGLIAFLLFCLMDRKLERSIKDTNAAPEESFRLKDIKLMIRLKGFWLITILCVLFYSAIFPFLKFATSMMINKYGIPENWAGNVPALISLGAIVLTPIFGGIYDKIGKGANIMFLGSFLIIIVHVCFALPFLNAWWIAAAVMILLGIAFSLVPSAMWPSVPKIIPQKQLGSAYATIFWVQNIGLAGVPTLIGWVLAKYCTTGNPDTPYDYTLPMLIFAGFGVAAAFVAYLLKKEDRKKGFGLQLPNIVRGK